MKFLQELFRIAFSFIELSVWPGNLYFKQIATIMMSDGGTQHGVGQI